VPDDGWINVGDLKILRTKCNSKVICLGPRPVIHHGLISSSKGVNLLNHLLQLMYIFRNNSKL